jgi:uncharacterized membrane protein
LQTLPIFTPALIKKCVATTLLLAGFVLVFPALTLYSEKKYRIIQWIGAVVICYATGMLGYAIGNYLGLAVAYLLQ